MNDSKIPAAGADKEDAKALPEKAAQMQRVLQEEAAKKAQDLKDKNQFTEAFTSKGAAHGNF